MGEEGSQPGSEPQWRLTPRRWLRHSGLGRSRQLVLRLDHRRRLCPEALDQWSQDEPEATRLREVAGPLPILREEPGLVSIVSIHHQVVDANA